MTKAGELYALAERCEQAKGPRWDIDEAIAEALGWYCRRETGLGLNGRTPGRTVWRRADHVKAPLPKFSKSIDAAMTLVPDGHCGQLQFGKHPGAWVEPLGEENPADFNVAATPALGLCAVALRAVAASVDGRRMAETENTGSVPQGTTSAVANGETPTPSSAQPGDA